MLQITSVETSNQAVLYVWGGVQRISPLLVKASVVSKESGVVSDKNAADVTLALGDVTINDGDELLLHILCGQYKNYLW